MCLGRLAFDLLPLVEQDGHVSGQFFFGRRFCRGSNNETVFFGLHPVENPAQSFAHVVRKALRNAVRLRIGNQHHESTGQRDLLGEPGALVRNRVLRDLAEDELLVLEDVLNAGVAALLLDVRRVVLHVAAVQHRVLGVAMSTNAASIPGSTFWT